MALGREFNLTERRKPRVKNMTDNHYDIAEHLRTPEEMAAYLEACFEEADGDAAIISKAMNDIARARNLARNAQFRLSPVIIITNQAAGRAVGSSEPSGVESSDSGIC
jgi:hypothetical protein